MGCRGERWPEGGAWGGRGGSRVRHCGPKGLGGINKWGRVAQAPMEVVAATEGCLNGLARLALTGSGVRRGWLGSRVRRWLARTGSRVGRWLSRTCHGVQAGVVGPIKDTRLTNPTEVCAALSRATSSD